MSQPASALPDPRELRREDFPVHRSMTTRWRDEDVYGHVNNVVHYELFDSAVNGWLIEACGCDVRDLPALGLVVETGCRYAAPVRFPDDVTAGLRLVRLGRTSVTYEIALFGGSATTAAAAGRFVHVYVERAGRRPTDVPATVRTALERELAGGTP